MKLKARRLIHVTVQALALLIAGSVNAKEYPVVPITKKVSVIYGPLSLPDERNRGFRNNVVVVKTLAGFVLFDPGGSAYVGEAIATQLKRSSSLPVVAVFNSHAHGDHWLGNEGIRKLFPRAVIYGHPKMISRLQAGSGKRWLDDINRVTKGTAKGTRVVIPDRQVKHGDAITIGQTTFVIRSPGRAHTDNDIMIEIVGERTIFTGDIVRNKLLGIMEEDASFIGNIEAIQDLLAKDFTHYIPGHGTAGGNAMVQNYMMYLTKLRSTVKVYYDKGLQDYEMKPRVLEVVSSFKSWEGFNLRVGRHISRAYLEVESEDFGAK